MTTEYSLNVFTKKTLDGKPVCAGFRLPTDATKEQLQKVAERVENACELWTWWNDKLYHNSGPFSPEFRVVHIEMKEWWTLLNDLNQVVRKM